MPIQLPEEIERIPDVNPLTLTDALRSDPSQQYQKFVTLDVDWSVYMPIGWQSKKHDN